jgi:hypothetical protein
MEKDKKAKIALMSASRLNEAVKDIENLTIVELLNRVSDLETELDIEKTKVALLEINLDALESRVSSVENRTNGYATHTHSYTVSGTTYITTGVN